MRLKKISVIGALAAGVAAAALVAAPAQAATIKPTAQQLSQWGFKTVPNVSQWKGGTATLSQTGTVPAYKDIQLKGTAASCLKPGTKLSLKRFVPTDNVGSGYFVEIGSGISTVVNQNHTYFIHFQFGAVGRAGYSLSGACSTGTQEVEFQLNITN